MIAKECLIVRDTTVEIKAGRASGGQTVGASGFGKENELLEAGADLILPSVVELPGELGLQLFICLIVLRSSDNVLH